MPHPTPSFFIGKHPVYAIAETRRRKSPSAALLDAEDAARLMGISLPAFRQRVQRGQIPRAAIVRTGRRVQFVRARLPGVAR